ncbi:MAG: hypothetical protein JW785_12310 [Acidimicrobiia bacterium]|nr:hypothetical protein [Acidimicrobiia bacterium]
MNLGYEGALFILAFDHRRSFKESLFGIRDRAPTRPSGSHSLLPSPSSGRASAPPWPRGAPAAAAGDTRRRQGRKYRLEMIVPATSRQLQPAGGCPASYDIHLRPTLMLEAMYEIQEAGIEPDIWKIEGVAPPRSAP